MKPQLLWDLRTAGSPRAVTVPELYQQVEDFVTSLKSEPPAANEVSAQGLYLQSALIPVAQAVPAEPSALQAQNLTLEALAVGMVAGCGDAFLLCAGEECSELESFIFQESPLTDAGALLRKGLANVRSTVSGPWSQTAADDLHLLSGYAKQENENSLQEGAQVAQDKGRAEFQRFLLATFKGGYATGAVVATAHCRE